MYKLAWKYVFDCARLLQLNQQWHTISLFTEELARYETFKSNMAKAKVLQDAEQATATYGATFFADMTGKMIISSLLGFI